MTSQDSELILHLISHWHSILTSVPYPELQGITVLLLSGLTLVINMVNTVCR